MPSTLSQPATLTAGQEPTVTYDPANHTITSTVIVAVPPSESGITVTTAPLAIPHGSWTLFWDLMVATTPELHAEFGDPGITFPLESLPPNITVESQPSGDATQVSAKIRNHVTTTNSFNYDVNVSWSLGESDVVVKHTVHDPTIVVTQDPIG